MTATTAPTPGQTALGPWLLPGHAECRARLDKAVTGSTRDARGSRRLRTLAAVARHALTEEVEIRLRDALGETLKDTLLRGWASYGAYRTAREKSLGEPGVDQLAVLQSHTITTEWTHPLDIEVDGFRVVTVTAQVDLCLTVVDAVAILRDGRLRELRSGHVHATGELEVEDVPITRRELEFPLALI